MVNGLKYEAAVALTLMGTGGTILEGSQLIQHAREFPEWSGGQELLFVQAAQGELLVVNLQGELLALYPNTEFRPAESGTGVLVYRGRNQVLVDSPDDVVTLSSALDQPPAGPRQNNFIFYGMSSSITPVFDPISNSTRVEAKASASGATGGQTNLWFDQFTIAGQTNFSTQSNAADNSQRVYLNVSETEHNWLATTTTFPGGDQEVISFTEPIIRSNLFDFNSHSPREGMLVVEKKPDHVVLHTFNYANGHQQYILGGELGAEVARFAADNEVFAEMISEEVLVVRFEYQTPRQLAQTMQENIDNQDMLAGPAVRTWLAVFVNVTTGQINHSTFTGRNHFIQQVGEKILIDTADPLVVYELELGDQAGEIALQKITLPRERAGFEGVGYLDLRRFAHDKPTLQALVFYLGMLMLGARLLLKRGD